MLLCSILYNGYTALNIYRSHCGGGGCIGEMRCWGKVGVGLGSGMSGEAPISHLDPPQDGTVTASDIVTALCICYSCFTNSISGFIQQLVLRRKHATIIRRTYETFYTSVFHTEGGELVISHLKLKFPPLSFADFCHILVLLPHPKNIIMSPAPYPLKNHYST